MWHDGSAAVPVTSLEVSGFKSNTFFFYCPNRICDLTGAWPMFHSFIAREDHRNFLRFLLFKGSDNTKEVVEYRMKVRV